MLVCKDGCISMKAMWKIYLGNGAVVQRSTGCQVLMVTNAAGSLKPNMPAGSLMMMTDHINFSLPNPLCGANDETIGPRFIGMDQAYDSSLQQNMRQAAAKANILLHEGVYLGCLGPSFETPAEYPGFFKVRGRCGRHVHHSRSYLSAPLRIASCRCFFNYQFSGRDGPGTFNPWTYPAAGGKKQCEIAGIGGWIFTHK